MLQYIKNIWNAIRAFQSLAGGLLVAIGGIVLALAGFLVTYYREISDFLLDVPGFVVRVLNSALDYIGFAADYLQQLAGFFEGGALQPYVSFLNTFVPISETIELLVFIGSFAVLCLMVRLCFKFTVLFR